MARHGSRHPADLIREHESRFFISDKISGYRELCSRTSPHLVLRMGAESCFRPLSDNERDKKFYPVLKNRACMKLIPVLAIFCTLISPAAALTPRRESLSRLCRP